MDRQLIAVVLAAGKGTRMKSRLPKAAHRLWGKAMARYPAEAAREAGAERIVLVVGHEADIVRAAVGDDVQYVLQAEQRGTGHAVMQADRALCEADDVLVLNGDLTLVTADELRQLVARHRATGAAATILTAELDDPSSYGRVIRRPDGSVERLVERRDASPAEVAVREINVGLYCFRAPDLRGCLSRLRPDNDQGEYYLTDVIGLLVAEGGRVEALRASDPQSALGINDRIELSAAAAILRQRILRDLMLSGVTVVDPASTYVDATVQVGQDTILHPMSILQGRTVIGADCEIGPSARIIDSTLSDRVRVHESVVAASSVGAGSRIGPFANLRPGCQLGREVKVGDFVELKNAVLADRVSAGHLSYLGDASVGEHTNIGAGTITCNYDGHEKHHTEIGKECFIGTHATLVAPVTIGEGAFVAAHSIVNEDVPADAMAIARSRQTVKEGWAARRRRAQEGPPK
jgi:bifunctional UDP-N-acetylglucosamine pyrophosphorylase / glucosamine-1-phosphate N-acetyltransferase